MYGIFFRSGLVCRVDSLARPPRRPPHVRLEACPKKREDLTGMTCVAVVSCASRGRRLSLSSCSGCWLLTGPLLASPILTTSVSWQRWMPSALVSPSAFTQPHAPPGLRTSKAVAPTRPCDACMHHRDTHERNHAAEGVASGVLWAGRACDVAGGRLWRGVFQGGDGGAARLGRVCGWLPRRRAPQRKLTRRTWRNIASLAGWGM
jgi:hypothetical protein